MKALMPLCLCVYLADSFHSNSSPSRCSVSISVNIVGVGVLSSSPSMWRSRSAAGDTENMGAKQGTESISPCIEVTLKPGQRSWREQHVSHHKTDIKFFKIFEVAEMCFSSASVHVNAFTTLFITPILYCYY